MSLFPGSVRSVVDALPIDTVLLGADGLPLFGFDPSRPDDAILTNVASAAVTTLLLAANPDRRRMIIYNDSSKNLRVAFAPTAGATAFTLLIPSKGLYESGLNDYTGDVSGIWEAANGFARVTEVTTA